MTEKTLTDILEHEPVIKEKFGEAAHLYMLAFLADTQQGKTSATACRTASWPSKTSTGTSATACCISC